MRSQNNREYEEVKHSIVGEANEEAESSQKANSNANATLGSSRHELARPVDINQGEIVNSAALPSLDGKNKSEEKDDVSESFEAEVEPQQKPLSKNKRNAKKVPKTSEMRKSPQKTVRQSKAHKDEPITSDPTPVDAVMEIESDKSENNESNSSQQEDIGQVEVINESLSADLSSNDDKVVKNKTNDNKLNKNSKSKAINIASKTAAKAPNKRTHAQTETRRSRSVKKVAPAKKNKPSKASSDVKADAKPAEGNATNLHC